MSSMSLQPPHRGPSRRAPFFSVSQPASASPLFPYTTLFRSVHRHRDRTTRITPDHIRELHEEHLAHSGQLDRSRDRCFMVLAYADGQIITCLAHTADQNGWTILYSAYDLDSWLDGTDLTDGDATQLAQEVNSE